MNLTHAEGKTSTCHVIPHPLSLRRQKESIRGRRAVVLEDRQQVEGTQGQEEP